MGIIENPFKQMLKLVFTKVYKGGNDLSFDAQASSGIKILQLQNGNSSTAAKVFVK